MKLSAMILLPGFCFLALCLLHALTMFLFSLAFQVWIYAMAGHLGCFLCLIITNGASRALPLVNTCTCFHCSKSLDFRVCKYSLWAKVLVSSKIVVPMFPLLVVWESQLDHTLTKTCYSLPLPCWIYSRYAEGYIEPLTAFYDN